MSRKLTLWHVRPMKSQISLRVCAVWSESPLSAWSNVASLAIEIALRDDSLADLNLRWACMSQDTFVLKLWLVYFWTLCMLQTVWIQIRPDVLSGLIGIQTVCKGYQQATKVANMVLWEFLVFYAERGNGPYYTPISDITLNETFLTDWSKKADELNVSIFPDAYRTLSNEICLRWRHHDDKTCAY